MNTPCNRIQDVSEHDTEDSAPATAQHFTSSLSAGLEDDQQLLLGEWHSETTQSRSTSRHEPDNLSSKLAQRLKDASTDLVDRLFDYLSNCPPPPSDETATEHAELPPQRGLTLPASAIGWLSSNLYPDGTHAFLQLERNGDGDDWWMEIPMRDRLPLIKYLLPRATHLRITSDEWPPRLPHKRKDSIDQLLDEAVDQDQSVSFSFRPSLGMSQETPSVEDQENDFLNYFYTIRHCPPIDLRLFPNLSVLLIDRVPPEWFRNMNALNDTLELLRLERGCIYDLTTFLFPQEVTDEAEAGSESESDNSYDSDESEPPIGVRTSAARLQRREKFPKLTHMKLSRCVIGELSGLTGTHKNYSETIDESMGVLIDGDSFMGEEEQDDGDSDVPSLRRSIVIPPLSRLTNLVSLSLAHNDIVFSPTAFAGLASLPYLSKLDLSFNRLSCMDGAFKMIGNLKILLLSGNRLRSSRGLDRLYSLEQLALDRNNIKDLADVAGLAKLPELSLLDLHGNPLERGNPKKYRVDLLNLFRECRFTSITANATYRQLLQILPSIDGRAATKRELMALRYLTFHSISSAGKTGDGPMIGDKDAKGSLPINGTTSSYNNEPIFESVPSNDVEVVSRAISSRQHVSRVTRQVRSRKVSIDEDATNTDSVPSTLRFEYARQGPKQGTSRTVLKGQAFFVKFTVQDVISSLPNSTSTAIESLPTDVLVEEEKALAVTNVYAGQVEKPCASLAPVPPTHTAAQLETASSKIDDNARSEAVLSHCDESDSVAELSLLSLSTVQSHDESAGNRYDEDEHVVSDEKSSNGEEKTFVNGTEKPKIAQDTAAPVTTGVSEEALTKESMAGDYLERGNSEEVFQSDVEINTDATATREAPPINETVVGAILKTTDFPEVLWDDEGSPTKGAKSKSQDNSTKFSWRSAEETSLYDGPVAYSHLNVLVNLELYFQCFVFPNPSATLQQPWYDKASEDASSAIELRTMPRIQLSKADRRLCEGLNKLDSRESFRHVWSEEVVACGKLAASRLAPNKTPRRGFHGDILFAQGKLATVSERRRMIFCSSSAAIYLISDYDAVTIQAQKKLNKRQFPLPIPEAALFEDAPWPHAVARHPVSLLHRITIGFGFQRLTLHFASLGSERKEFTYVLITCNKLNTIALLRQLQEHVKESTPSSITDNVEDSIIIDNDDKQLLDALSAAVAPKVVDVVLHYQVLQQRWKHGDRGTVRRACVVSDSGLFLLDEDYVGDGSTGSYEVADETKLGDVRLTLVESAELSQVVDVLAADADPRSITIVIRPQHRLQRTHRWRLLCRDGDGAERLVEDVRKAISTL